MRWSPILFLGAAGAAAAILGLPGCGGGSSSSPPPAEAQDHTNIVLRDRLGQPLTADSAEPYSPRATCGVCHDIDTMANGYHFQQGRTDAAGQEVTQPDYFGDGRFWLLSAGMYGKW